MPREDFDHQDLSGLCLELEEVNVVGRLELRELQHAVRVERQAHPLRGGQRIVVAGPVVVVVQRAGVAERRVGEIERALRGEVSNPAGSLMSSTKPGTGSGPAAARSVT